jgi:hypothetical protein
MAVGRGVGAVAEIGLDLDEAQDEWLTVGEPVDQPTADQIGRDGAGIACVEGLSKRAGGRHLVMIGKPTADARVPKGARSRPGRLEPPAGTADAL